MRSINSASFFCPSSIRKLRTLSARVFFCPFLIQWFPLPTLPPSFSICLFTAKSVVLTPIGSYTMYPKALTISGNAGEFSQDLGPLNLPASSVLWGSILNKYLLLGSWKEVISLCLNTEMTSLLTSTQSIHLICIKPN